MQCNHCTVTAITFISSRPLDQTKCDKELLKKFWCTCCLPPPRYKWPFLGSWKWWFVSQWEPEHLRLSVYLFWWHSLLLDTDNLEYATLLVLPIISTTMLAPFSLEAPPLLGRRIKTPTQSFRWCKIIVPLPAPTVWLIKCHGEVCHRGFVPWQEITIDKNDSGRWLSSMQCLLRFKLLLQLCQSRY